MQDWRMVSMDNCELINSIPGNDEFWKYFNENYLQMSAEEKMSFML